MSYTGGHKDAAADTRGRGAECAPGARSLSLVQPSQLKSLFLVSSQSQEFDIYTQYCNNYPK